MKKHGCLWWVFIGWWWAPITLPFRLLAALIRRGRKYAAGTEERVQRIQAWGAAQEAKQAAKKAERIERVNMKMRPEKKVEPPEDQPQPEPVPGLKKETHKVAGVSFRQDALQALGTKNPDFAKTKKQLINEGLTDEWIYEYIFAPEKVELIPEPDNPHSENGNAIKVVVDGQHIGYIKSGSSAHVSKLIKEDRIQQVDCFIGGGRSKTVTAIGFVEDENGVIESCTEYTVEKDEIGFYARLTITTKP